MNEPVDRIAQRAQASQDRSDARRIDSPSRTAQAFALLACFLCGLIVVSVLIWVAIMLFSLDDLGLTH